MLVLIDEPAEHGVAPDWSSRWCDGELFVLGRALASALVWPMSVVVLDKSREHRGCAVLVAQQNLVGALGPYGADSPFCVAVRSRGLRWGLNDGDALSSEDITEGMREFVVSISDQELE